MFALGDWFLGGLSGFFLLLVFLFLFLCLFFFLLLLFVFVCCCVCVVCGGLWVLFGCGWWVFGGVGGALCFGLLCWVCDGVTVGC